MSRVIVEVKGGRGKEGWDGREEGRVWYHLRAGSCGREKRL